MNVSLTPELEKLVADKVAAGMYASASEVIRDALRLLEERDVLRQAKLEALKKEIQKGIEQLDRGEATDLNESELRALMDRIKSEGRKKLAGRDRRPGAA